MLNSASATGSGNAPFRQFILKVASRCNLACDYCYVYHGPDQGWRAQPRVMAPATIAATAQAIGQHARAHNIDEVHIAFHGGEPLLAGPAALGSAIATLQAALPPSAKASLRVQTNGLLLDEELLRLFARHDVRVGISLDGGRAANDRHRRRADGRSSHAAVVRALELLSADDFHTLFAGLLCTIDLANDPVATYQALTRFAPPMIDFLLPLGNWAHPPPGLEAHQDRDLARTPYADWLVPIFDHWYASPEAPRVRIFDEIIALILGAGPGTEIVGGGTASFIVVETDGTMEAADSLKSAYPGAASTGLSVFTSVFDDAGRHPTVMAQRQGASALCDSCQACPVREVCGGGQYAHRYSARNGFANPSVYCADLLRLITHIGQRVLRDLRSIQGARS